MPMIMPPPKGIGSVRSLGVGKKDILCKVAMESQDGSISEQTPGTAAKLLHMSRFDKP